MFYKILLILFYVVNGIDILYNGFMYFMTESPLSPVMGGYELRCLLTIIIVLVFMVVDKFILRGRYEE